MTRDNAREPASRLDVPACPVTLESLVENVGAGVLSVIRAPVGLGVAVGEIIIHDPMDRRPVEPGDLILAVGVDSSARDASALLRRAGDSGAAGVVVKVEADGAPEALLAASDDAGVALLGVAGDAVWGQLHALVRTACAVAGVPGEIGSGDVPVGDLFALANAVASMVGGATTIEDPRSTVLAYSSTDAPIDEPRRRTILGRRVPEDWLRRLEADGVFRRIWAGGVVRVDYTDTDPGYRARLAVAVRAGGEILGTIWAIEGDKPLDARAEAALAEGARIAALHMLRHRGHDDLERRRRAEHLRSVLEGRVPPETLASSLGMGRSSFVTVVAFHVRLGDARLADQTVIIERATSSIAIHCEAYRRQAASVADGRVIYVLLADRERPQDADVTRFASSLVEHLASGMKLDVIAGVGVTVQGLGGVLASRSEADQALRALADEPRRTVAHIDAIRSKAILLSLRDLAARDPSLRGGKVQRLISVDQDRQTLYVETLRAYLDAFGDVAAAAARVNVHPNTFRYRLRRLLELSDIDLGDPSERLVAHLQLTFLEAGAEE